MCAAVAVVAILALLPAYFSLVIPRMSLSSVQVSEEQRAQEEEDRVVSSRMRALLTALAPYAESRPSVSDVISKAISLRPSGITLQRITYQAGALGEITFIGEALSREQVNEYRETLAEDPVFESVSVPVAALVGASAGNFTMTLKGNF
jgi:hypothetical protein